jgi:mRNA interferase HicA
LKRRQLLRHLKKHGCSLLREGSNHSIYQNDETGAEAPVPRHTEVDNVTARVICKELGIPSL